MQDALQSLYGLGHLKAPRLALRSRRANSRQSGSAPTSKKGDREELERLHCEKGSIVKTRLFEGLRDTSTSRAKRVYSARERMEGAKAKGGGEGRSPQPVSVAAPPFG